MKVVSNLVKQAFRGMGYDVIRLSEKLDRQLSRRKYERYLAYEADPFFQRTYREGMERTGFAFDGEDFKKRQERLYDLVHLLLTVEKIEGDIAECGCFRGLSAYFICRYLQCARPGFDGEGFTIIDSFEGLPEGTAQDRIEDEGIPVGSSRIAMSAGGFSATRDEVRRALEGFPRVVFQKGWVPEVLASLPERKYRFVNVDLDLYAPTLAALEYFYPRMVDGGLMVCDDFGSLYWPGAGKAVEEFRMKTGAYVMPLSTGQAVVFSSHRWATDSGPE